MTVIGVGGFWLTQGQLRIRESHMVVDMEPRSGRGGQLYPCSVVRHESQRAGSVPVWVQRMSEEKARRPRGNTSE